MRPGRNAPSSLEDAVGDLRRGMGAARRGGESLFELRSAERKILRQWCQTNGCVFRKDPTLNLERRKSHGEHTVAFDPANAIWWKTTHPGKAGVGAEFHYEAVPPFRITGVSARELLPSEYLSRMLLHNREFGDDVRFEGYLDGEQPSLIVSQPHIKGAPATDEDMIGQMLQLDYLSLGMLEIGKRVPFPSIIQNAGLLCLTLIRVISSVPETSPSPLMESSLKLDPKRSTDGCSIAPPPNFPAKMNRGLAFPA